VILTPSRNDAPIVEGVDLSGMKPDTYDEEKIVRFIDAFKNKAQSVPD
jgi:hypothetical protein